MKISKLNEPFSIKDIEWRIQQSGIKEGKPWARVLAYIEARAIQQRLDDICGPENWKNEFKEGPAGGVLCGISIKITNELLKEGQTIQETEWVTKWDGAENTDFEKIKGGLSNSFKRAAVQWGIGRYLYDIPAGFAYFNNEGKYRDKIKQNKNDAGRWFRWDPPELPEWALTELDKENHIKKEYEKSERKQKDEKKQKEDEKPGYYDVLREIQECKKQIDELEYYTTLEKFGIKKANQIKNEFMANVLSEMKNIVNRNQRFNRLMVKAQTELLNNGVVETLVEQYGAIESVIKKGAQLTIYEAIKKEYEAATEGKKLTD